MNDELVYAHAGFGRDAVPYLAAWGLQRAVHQRRADGEIADACLMLEHEPVYTAGKRTEPADRPAGDAGAPVVDVDRGGRITWHGPGQLVGYIRSLEEALIRTCADFGVTAQRIGGRSGAWITGGGAPDRKVGAIGARVARGVTMHGFALNCDCDLSWFGRIVPCGISDAGVTSLTAETGRRITVTDALPVMERHLAEALGHPSWRCAEGTDTLTGTGALAGRSQAGRS